MAIRVRVQKDDHVSVRYSVLARAHISARILIV